MQTKNIPYQPPEHSGTEYIAEIPLLEAGSLAKHARRRRGVECRGCRCD